MLSEEGGMTESGFSAKLRCLGGSKTMKFEMQEIDKSLMQQW